MRILPKLVGSVTVVALALLAACGSPHDDAADVTVEMNGPSIEAKPNPCAAVKCPDATHCESHGKHATCAADPACATDADCYLSSNYCSGAGACTCTAHEISVRVACTTPEITCSVDPCAGLAAACVNGACAKI